MNNKLKVYVFICYSLSIIFIILGFHKMFVYDILTNAYVGGDAYNFIINANYAIAYFVLAIFTSIIATTIYFSGILKNLEMAIRDSKFQDFIKQHTKHDYEADERGDVISFL